MKITDRIKRICPEADVYWNANNSLTLIYPETVNINVNAIKSKICAELDKVGMLRAVEGIRIMQ